MSLADIQVSAEGGQEMHHMWSRSYMQPEERPVVEQAVPPAAHCVLHEADLHVQPMEEPMVQQVDVA